jgi:hypothetical protein
MPPEKAEESPTAFAGVAIGIPFQLHFIVSAKATPRNGERQRNLLS